MISFIVIGRNEGWKLTRSVESISKAIEYNRIIEYEIIYVDSNSSDDSIERAKQFNRVKIFKLIGICNPAIARNIGVKESSGDVLFFIDGDMEIKPDFLALVYSEKHGLKYPFVSGQLKNYNYNRSGNLINNSWQYKAVLSKDKYFSSTGGIFLIDRKLWLKVEGMDIRFKRGEDLDLGLRLAKLGCKILRKKEIIANHHTISYTYHYRMWDTIFSGDISYASSFLLRKHFFNRYVYPKLAKQYYTLWSLLLSVFIVLLKNQLYFLIIYFVVVFIKTFRSKSSTWKRFLELFFFYIVRDISFLLFLFMPLPKIKNNSIKFTLVSDTEKF